MPIDADGRFYPSLYPKQKELMQACNPSSRNFVLANGPRLASKTFGCLHAVCQHAWNTDRADICILTVTQSVGIDSGVWADLTEYFLPEWIAGDFGMEWVRKPFTQSVTKKPCCIVTNKHGTKSKISLESLKNEDEVEQRFKGKSFSMIWVNELSKFKYRKTFDTLKYCFRKPYLKDNEHLFLADTNPDLDLGTTSPWFHLWYELRDMPDIPEAAIPLRDSLRLIEFTVEDNLSLSAEKKAKMRADFDHNPDVFDAYYNGKWTTASADALFYQVFRQDVHVVGGIATPANKTPEILAPSENTFELITGLDPGGTNCSFHIIEKIIPDTLEYPSYGGKPIFLVYDELIVVGEDFDLQDYIEEMVRKMTSWERMTTKGEVLWRHWSDRSVFDMKVPFSDRYWHSFFYELSGGKIVLNAADRGKGSVGLRIDLFRKLLFENRVFFNNNYCPKTIEMVKGLKRGTTVAGGIARGSPHKHAFDSLTYALASECFEELSASIIQTVRDLRTEKNESSLVSFAL